jgi:capsular polysaccharide biosynthesis protein
LLVLIKKVVRSSIHYLTGIFSSFFIKGKTLLPSFQVERRFPQNFREKDRVLFKQQLKKHFGPVKILHIKKARLVVEQGVVIKAFTIVEASLIEKSMFLWYGPQFIFNAYKKANWLNKKIKYLFVYNHYSLGYGHWLADVLPRLYLIKNNLKNYKILLPETYNTFHLGTLKPFGITEKDITYLKNESYLVPDLTIVSHVAESCNTKDEILQELRDFYLKYYFNISLPTAYRKLYISRSKQAIRKVINEEEVQSLVKNYGYEVIYPEDYSFEEQVKLFAGCKTMIGLTGSGLTNMLFMQAESTVLEFKMKGDEHNLHYFSMSSGLHLDYYYLLCTVEGKDRFSGEFQVDIPALRAILRRIA